MSKRPREDDDSEPIAEMDLCRLRPSSKLKTMFGQHWMSIVAKLPDWATQLDGLAESEICEELQWRGVSPHIVGQMGKELFAIIDSVSQRFVTALRAGYDFDTIAELAKCIANDPRYQISDETTFLVTETWNADHWFDTLHKGRTSLHGLRCDRGPHVLGLSAGPGCGKTHRLRQLQHFRPDKNGEERVTKTDAIEKGPLDAHADNCFVFVAYSMNQDVEFDRKYAERSIYLRVFLRDLGVSNRGCEKFLTDNFGILRCLDEDLLLDFV